MTTTILHVPDEVMLYLFSFLVEEKPLEILKLPLVCSAWNDIIKKEGDVVIFRTLFVQLTEQMRSLDKSIEISNAKLEKNKKKFYGIRNRKKKKDPNEPKKNLSSFLLFSNARRAELKQQNPSLKPMQVSKLLGELWRSMPARDKKQYVDAAVADKMRYDAEMRAYQKQLEDKARAAFDATCAKEFEEIGQRSWKRLYIVKYTGAFRQKKREALLKGGPPKRPSGPFHAYCQDMKQRIKREHPNVTRWTDLVKILSKKWNEEEPEAVRQKYIAAHREAKAAWTKDLNEYIQGTIHQNGNNNNNNNNDDNDDDGFSGVGSGAGVGGGRGGLLHSFPVLTSGFPLLPHHHFPFFLDDDDLSDDTDDDFSSSSSSSDSDNYYYYYHDSDYDFFHSDDDRSSGGGGGAGGGDSDGGDLHHPFDLKNSPHFRRRRRRRPGHHAPTSSSSDDTDSDDSITEFKRTALSSSSAAAVASAPPPPSSSSFSSRSTPRSSRNNNNNNNNARGGSSSSSSTPRKKSRR